VERVAFVMQLLAGNEAQPYVVYNPMAPRGVNQSAAKPRWSITSPKLTDC
jgi:hypothetical protein